MVAESKLVNPAGLQRVPSLVFDIELEDTVGTNNIIEDDQSGIQDLRKWLLPHDSIEFKLRNDVEAALEELPPGNRSLSSYQTLASKLTRLGYHVHIRTALGGGDGYECLRNLRHIFLCVEVPAVKSESQRLIVDLNFKDQFSIAKSTAYYSQLHECLPEVYVAPEASITPLVNFLCQEIAVAFHANGAVLPPWRHARSMLSKWLPRKSLDEPAPTFRACSEPQLPSPTSPAAPSSPTTLSPPLPAAAAPVFSSGVTAAVTADQHRVGGRSLEGVAGFPGVYPMHMHWDVRGGAGLHGAMHMGPVLPQMPLSQPFTQTVVKPVACEPLKVVKGGNFIVVGPM